MQDKVEPAPRPAVHPEIEMLIVDARNDWADRTKQDIVARVEKMLDGALDTIVIESLGFCNRYGRVEIDHCNGREPAITELLKDQMHLVSVDIVSQALKTWKPKPSFLKAIREDYDRQLGRRIHEVINDRVRTDAEAFVVQALLSPHPGQAVDTDDTEDDTRSAT